MFVSGFPKVAASRLRPLYSGVFQHRRLLSRSSDFTRSAANVQAKSHTLTHSEANRKARIELAAAYRGLDKLNYNEGICNHLTLMAPAANGDGEIMLVIPYGLHWSEVRAQPCLKCKIRAQPCLKCKILSQVSRR